MSFSGFSDRNIKSGRRRGSDENKELVGQS
jgi:hypothetical protein